jgi:hypothetical protein
MHGRVHVCLHLPMNHHFSISYVCSPVPCPSQIPRHLQLRPHKSYMAKTLTVYDYRGGGPRKLRGRCQGYFTRNGLECWAGWLNQKAGYCYIGEWRAGERYLGHWYYPDKTKYSGFFKDNREYGEGMWQNCYGEACKWVCGTLQVVRGVGKLERKV